MAHFLITIIFMAQSRRPFHSDVKGNPDWDKEVRGSGKTLIINGRKRNNLQLKGRFGQFGSETRKQGYGRIGTLK